jgi:alpha-beta hydrolase superfamily lysophospholipase
LVLVLPGLNLHPAALDGLCMALAERGCLVYRGSLSGHGGPQDRWPDDCRAAWRADTAFQVAACVALAHARRLPLAAIGFSLGALCLAEAALSAGPGVSGPLSPSAGPGASGPLSPSAGLPDDAPLVLLSPPFLTRRAALPIRILSRLPGLAVPSLNTPELRVHRTTATRAYHALFRLAADLRERLAGLAGRPLLVAVDPRDRLIASARIARRLTKAPFAAGTFLSINSAGPDHHKVGIKEAHAPESWSALLEAIACHLST